MTEEKSGRVADEAAISLGRRVGLGCFTGFAGLWSGAMVAVLLGMGIEAARRAPTCEGLPTCNWFIYAATGALVGAVSLPTLVFWRLRRGTARSNLRG